MVFYRKYRPQTISELDSKDIQRIFVSCLGRRNVPHAFLFTGPKGLGKTSTARIVAKTLNCEVVEKKRAGSKENETFDPQPCTTCNQCVSIANGTNIDILEIDGASNRGIDEIRDLREKIRLAPVAASKKVYIIDEVHMLTTEAFNALLKTLEEPPDHAVFILCTTEPHKVPATILSRCFHVAFKRATQQDIVHSLRRIATGENITVDDEALSRIASFADGGFRDAAKIFEEVVMFSVGKPITKKTVDTVYKTTGITQYNAEMIAALAQRDTKKALTYVNQLIQEGVDMKYVLEQLIAGLHTYLLRNVGIQDQEGDFTAKEIELSTSEVIQILQLLDKAHNEMKYTVLPQLPLEVAILTWGMEEEKNENKATERTRTEQPLQNHNEEYSEKSAAAGRETEKKKEQKGTSALLEKREQLWQQFVDTVRVENHTVAGLLRSCFLKTYDGKQVVIEASYQFHRDRLQDTAAQKILQQVWQEMTGNSVAISVSLKDK